MRNIELVPYSLRRIAKKLVSPSHRKRLHHLDYQLGQLMATYNHHLWVQDSPCWKSHVRLAFHLCKRILNRPVVLSYPGLPGPGSVIYKLLLHLGYRVTDNPREQHDLAMRFEWGTYGEIDDILLDLSTRSRVINFNAVDISKSTVCDVFEEVFPYSLRVDPCTYEGPILRKSDLNATHDGTILQGPIAKIEVGFVYQRLINNLEAGLAKDFRVIVVGDEIPFVRVKYRPIEKRFDHAGRSQVHDEVQLATDVFTSNEQIRILSLCQKMGLDFGELDVLRDRKNGQIYVVDVNKTPTGPTFVSTEKETIKWCFDAMGEAFIRAFMPGHERRTLPSAY